MIDGEIVNKGTTSGLHSKSHQQNLTFNQILHLTRLTRIQQSLLLLAILMYSFPGFAVDNHRSANCHLVLGWGNWPPYQTDINSNKPYGIQIDLVTQIANKAGCSLEFRKQTFSENIDSVKVGTVDFIMDTTVTEERKIFGYFSDPYRLEILALYLRPELTPNCNNASFADIVKTGAKIGMNRGNIYGESVTQVQHTPTLNQKLIYADNNDLLYQWFEQGKIDGFFEDPAVMAFNLRNMRKNGALIVCKITQKTSTVSFLFSKKTTTPALVERFNQALKQVKKTNEYRSLWSW